MPPLVYFDDYKDCLLEFGEAATYCLTHIYIKPDRSSELWRYLSLFYVNNTNHYRHDVLKRGICLNRCRTKISRNDHINVRKFDFNPFQPYPNRLLGSSPVFTVEDDESRDLYICINKELEQNYSLSGHIVVNFCMINELEADRIKIDKYDWYFTTVIVLLLVAVALGTIFNLSGVTSKLFISFSLKKNMSSLTDLKNESILINGLKAGMMWAVLVGHTMSIRFNFSIFNSYDMECTINQPKLLLAPTATFYVSNFMFLNGYLAFYSPYHSLLEGKLYNWREVLMKRIIRLVPVIGFVVFFHATFFTKMLTSPQWIEIAENVRLNCRNNWWINLLLLNNVLRPSETCAVQSKR